MFLGLGIGLVKNLQAPLNFDLWDYTNKMAFWGEWRAVAGMGWVCIGSRQGPRGYFLLHWRDPDGNLIEVSNRIPSSGGIRWHSPVKSLFYVGSHRPEVAAAAFLTLTYSGFRSFQRIDAIMKNVLILGGSGFVGNSIANRLVAQGIKVTVPTRRRSRAMHVTTLPLSELVEADIHDPAVLASLVEGKDAVINLLGILHSRDVKLPYSRDFEKNHVEFPAKLITACRKAGVKRVLHMSALKASADAPSEYLRSKAAGEKLLREATDLDVTVFRPSVIFGAGDHFLSLFARFMKLPAFYYGSAKAKFQPVFVGDVAGAFVDALQDRETVGCAYDLVGPRVYTLREIIEYVYKLSGATCRLRELGETLTLLQAGLLWLLPKPPLSPDNLRSMQIDSICHEYREECQFPKNWNPAAMETVAPTYISASVAPKRRMDLYRAVAGR